VVWLFERPALGGFCEVMRLLVAQLLSQNVESSCRKRRTVQQELQ
jgi:hypothetical protein